MVKRRDVLVPMSVNWLELYLLGICALAGAGGLFGFGNPSTSHLPAWADTAWYALLLAGSGLGVVGCLWPDAITGLLIERAGMWPVAAGAAMYAAAVAHTGQWLSALVLAGFGACAAAHARKITHLARTTGG
jgi:hypothetical protein